jgi:fructokinase
MITVLGGALVNLVPTSDETVLRALPGGSAFNIAIGTARQGFPTALMARFSRDAFGQMLRRHAERVGVDLSAAAEADEPTTIALMPASPAKSPRSLYLEGTASRQWTSDELALIPSETTVLHIGSAVHWPAPIMARILRAAGRLRRHGALVSVDLNIRPEITEALGETPGQSRLLLDRLLRSADVIRTSTAEVGWLFPERAPAAVAESWVKMGPGLVVVASGASSAMAVRGSGLALHRQSHRGNGLEHDGGPCPVDATDAIGAADGFTAGLLGTLYQLKQKETLIEGLNAEDLSEMLDSALRAAATSVAGCENIVDGTLTALSKYF